MVQILIASLLLSIIHASIPNHWLPLIAIGKTEKWTQGEIMRATLITGFAHTLSTVLIGIIVGFFGYKLSSSYEIISGIIAPSILIVLGIIYLVLDLSDKEGFEHNHHHDEFLHKSVKEDFYPLKLVQKKKTKWSLLASMSIGMFFTPCAEIEAYYFQASTIGWAGIWIVSAVYTFVTIGGMLLLVYLGMHGAKHLESHYMEHHEKRITGIVLIAIGLLTYFVKF
ncbi:urease accessory protein UreH domain-containing protein [Flavobacterium humi]|uniref:Urease accessory protein UreH-like transmembrane domain-containing protein n=1 Tax=Flavobacterium humi TaxID=2562683 RepID=A0A4Z0LBM1_9FLAO|nr:sulfite exporter TauE/SafE family protein [Flavobacterium humi]TGD59258.1 hypothetical protein E4635_05250 [Flavobacterium humi]